MPLRMIGRSYSLRWHLTVFGIVVLLPVAALATLLLLRTASLERAHLEARVLHTAEDIARAVDRELARDFTVLDTLAALPSLAKEDWPAFYEQAKSGLRGKAYVVVIDANLQQLEYARTLRTTASDYG